MKTKSRYNPMGRKTYNPNHEPWLTLYELFTEAEILQKNYLKWK